MGTGWRRAAYRKAIQLDPSYSLAHRMLGIALGHMGQHEEEARQVVDRARALDPLLAMHHALSAQVAFVTRDYSAAIQYARQATVIHADFWIGHYQLAQAYEQQGAYEFALNALDKAGSFGGGNSKVLALRGYVLAKLGREREALAVLENSAVARAGSVHSAVRSGSCPCRSGGARCRFPVA